MCGMKQSITIKVNAWIICAVLLVANLITVGLWRPWENQTAGDRTIAITGSTTLEAAPDQFVFSPYYQKEGADKTAVNAQLSELSKTIIAELKKLGVADSAIKTDVNSYDYGIYYSGPENKSATTTLYVTVTVKDKELAQKVQDYLTSTTPSGAVTPQISFSSAKQKELETQARDGALKDAKQKAEATANELGTKLGKVVTVSDITSGGITPLPWMMNSAGVTEDSAKSPTSGSYSIQPGLQEYSFRVQVTYELN